MAEEDKFSAANFWPVDFGIVEVSWLMPLRDIRLGYYAQQDSSSDNGIVNNEVR